MPLSTYCHGGVRVLDRPCPANVRRLDEGAFPMIEEFHRNGFQIDVRTLNELESELLELEDTAQRNLTAMVGHPVNWNSGDQVAELLFRELRVSSPVEVKKTASGSREAVDDEMLSALVEQHPCVNVIREGRGLTKLRTTYAAKLPTMINPSTGRLHTTFKHTRTATGRLASEDPNLQNIPVRSKLGNRIREAFVARPGCKLLSCDYSQIEMVLAAHLSEDPVMSQAFRDKADIHTLTALEAFRLPPDAVNWPTFKRDYRLPAKTIGFGILYGQTAQGAQTNILTNGGPLWTVQQCEDLIRRWFGVYRGIEAWMDYTFARARRYGMVWDMWGRMRRIPEARSRIGRIASAGLRQAGNMPIQSSAQGFIKLAMAVIMPLVEQVRSYGLICNPLLQIHDELIFEVEESVVEDFAFLAREAMEGVCEISVPVRSSSIVGDNWGQLKD